MIFIVVKFAIRPGSCGPMAHAGRPLHRCHTRRAGQPLFEWSRSVETPHQFVLLEAFRDRAAGEAHVRSEHFKAAIAWMPDAVAATPDIIHVEVPGAGWSTMAELQPRPAP